MRLFERDPVHQSPMVPIMLGFGMPDHAEMASPIRPAPTRGVHLINELPGVTIIQSAEAADVTVETPGPILADDASKTLSR